MPASLDFNSRLREAYDQWEMNPKIPFEELNMPSYKEGFKYAEEKGISIQKMLSNLSIWNSYDGNGDPFDLIEPAEKDTFKKSLCIMSPAFKQAVELIDFLNNLR